MTTVADRQCRTWFTLLVSLFCYAMLFPAFVVLTSITVPIIVLPSRVLIFHPGRDSDTPQIKT